ncbi:CRISPR-associated endonuclease Cas1 [Candidatus Chloroploca sp. Khr17]|uniref:CRISPR-associated endonuclease Cas1 n=1 Tax=Candidatus Chloroploca sp. Khr17 TaxID=2496869 RepID=UPI00101C9494|nr:CRISPR-associated endonuclease Cas1 [Candidatus Chloroploca sp. Khr17]
MATLYVQEQGAMVRKEAQRVIISKQGQILQEIPLNKIDQVVLMGRGVQMSTALLVDLIGRGVPVMLTNQRGSRHYATLTAGPSRFGALRLQHMQRVIDPAWTLELARAIVAAKLSNQRTMLAASGWSAAPTAVAQITTALGSLEHAVDVDAVRGYEGAGAAAYFGAWRTALQQAWGFQGRAFYPPPDPVNAMLSFGYTLLMHDVLNAVQFTGLDPYLGVFHVIEAGRPSLALDLMEEFRPLVVDRLVLELVGTGAMRRDQFERPAQRPDAVYLDATGRALLVERYETVMQAATRLPTGEQTPMRRMILLQAQAVARVVRGEQERYRGYTP